MQHLGSPPTMPDGLLRPQAGDQPAVLLAALSKTISRLDRQQAHRRGLAVFGSGRRYPDTHDGWDRLGMVHEARGENVQAAECYRKLIAFLRHNPDYADPDMAQHYTKLSAKLDPPAT